MMCRKCGSAATAVVASYDVGENRKRRYRCSACGERFNTMERWCPGARPDKRRKEESEDDHGKV